ncbi:MAG: CHASE3 domain-containing protein, partial [Chitinophagaceae bacterium]
MPKRSNTNLQGGFGVSLLLLLASSVASFISIRELIKSSGWVTHTNVVIQKLEEVISFAKDAETGQRGFLLTHDVSYLGPYNGTYEKMVNTFNELKKLTADNPQQQENLDQLKVLVDQRFKFLKVSIDSVQANKSVDVNNLKMGRDYMDQCRTLVDKMKATEDALLVTRTQRTQKLIKSTPILIIFAAIMAILITAYFYRRVSGNFAEISKLNSELTNKDEQIASRINAIQSIAARISQGDYKTRANDEEKDGLGGLSGSLNKMAQSLDKSFTEIEGREWLQTGAAEVGKSMVGEKPVTVLTNDILTFLANYTKSTVGAFYLSDNETNFILKGSYALSHNHGLSVKVGQGLVGQCAKDGRAISIDDLTDNDFTISFSAGEVKPKSIYVFPIYFENRLLGVIEMGSRETFTQLQKDLFKSISENIGIAINAAYNRARLQELLEETQAQSEELQAQHSELEGLNTELETQAHKLQSS